MPAAFWPFNVWIISSISFWTALFLICVTWTGFARLARMGSPICAILIAAISPNYTTLCGNFLNKKFCILRTMAFQIIPLILAVIIFVFLSLLIYLEIFVLNFFTSTDIILKLRISDVLVGLTIYLKTAVDFAIFIGNLMASYPGMKGRIAIEMGTAVGNALGTMLILLIWNIFREVDFLLAGMVFVASLVLLKLAQEGLEHSHGGGSGLPNWFFKLADNFEKALYMLNKITGPFLNVIVPDLTMRPKRGLALSGLFAFSFTIPFILGLDDFAGYVPIFSVVNVFGFSVGVLAGHMVLNIFLFISPKRTIQAVRNPVISFLGSVAFVGLALWGFFEVYRILFGHA